MVGVRTLATTSLLIMLPAVLVAQGSAAQTRRRPATPPAAAATAPQAAAPAPAAAAAADATTPLSLGPSGAKTASAPRELGEAVAAIVNDDIISTYDLRQRMRLLAFSSGIQITDQTAAEVAREALRSLVDEHLQMQEIQSTEKRQKSLKIVPTDKEIDEEIAGIAKQYGTTQADLMKSLVQAGIDPKTMRTQIAAQAAWRRYVQIRYQDSVHVGDDQVNAALDRISANAAKPQYQVSEIFIDASKVGGQAQAESGARDLVQQIRGGAPFNAVARQFSALPTAANGGDAGWLVSGQMQPVLETAVAALRPGQVSDPIPVQDGVYILQLRNRRAGAAASMVSLKQAAIRLAADATPAQVADAESKLDAIKTAAGTCKNLETEAAKTQGVVTGDLGEASVEELSPDFKKVVDTLKTGEVGGPVRTAAGLHLIGVCSRRTGGAQEPTRADIENQIFGEQLDMLARRYLRDLRNSAAIDTK